MSIGSVLSNNEQEAEDGLKKTCEWRAKVKPQNLTIDDLGEVGKTGFMFHYGYDKLNRPVVYIGMYLIVE